MKTLGKLLAVFALVCIGAGQAEAQGSVRHDKANKATEVSNLISSGQYTFVATKLVSGKNESEPLKASYDLDISKDTLVAHLPGYQRVIHSAIGDNALTCNYFSYRATPGKKGSQIIIIRPEAGKAGDMNDIQELRLDISALGYATLTVKGSKPISCYGYIREHIAEFRPVSARLK